MRLCGQLNTNGRTLDHTDQFRPAGLTDNITETDQGLCFPDMSLSNLGKSRLGYTTPKSLQTVDPILIERGQHVWYFSRCDSTKLETLRKNNHCRSKAMTTKMGRLPDLLTPLLREPLVDRHSQLGTATISNAMSTDQKDRLLDELTT